MRRQSGGTRWRELFGLIILQSFVLSVTAEGMVNTNRLLTTSPEKRVAISAKLVIKLEAE